MIIMYDDNSMDIMNKVNLDLAAHGLKFQHDELAHDGYDVYTLTDLRSSFRTYDESTGVCGLCGRASCRGGCFK